MNCFPCKGPACHACGKFDRINKAAARDNDNRCSGCGGQVDLESGRCMSCGLLSIAPPGASAKSCATAPFHAPGKSRG